DRSRIGTIKQAFLEQCSTKRRVDLGRGPCNVVTRELLLRRIQLSEMLDRSRDGEVRLAEVGRDRGPDHSGELGLEKPASNDGLDFCGNVAEEMTVAVE